VSRPIEACHETSQCAPMLTDVTASAEHHRDQGMCAVRSSVWDNCRANVAIPTPSGQRIAQFAQKVSSGLRPERIGIPEEDHDGHVGYIASDRTDICGGHEWLPCAWSRSDDQVYEVRQNFCRIIFACRIRSNRNISNPPSCSFVMVYATNLGIAPQKRANVDLRSRTRVRDRCSLPLFRHPLWCIQHVVVFWDLVSALI